MTWPCGLAIRHSRKEITARLPAMMASSGVLRSSRTPDAQARSGRLVPMKRAGRPEEVADLVTFLASDKAGYISGQIVSINGGMA